MAEEITNNFKLENQSFDKAGKPIPMIFQQEKISNLIFNTLKPHITSIETHFSISYTGITPTKFTWSSTNTPQSLPICENSKRIDNVWTRIHNFDLTCVLFLSDFNDKPPFDNDFEVYGGKLEFPSWGFGFNPTRGTLIIYPSVPNFINITSKVEYGNLVVGKFNIATKIPFLFDIKQYPGDITSWFQNII